MRVLLLMPLHESSEHVAMKMMVAFEHSALAAEPNFAALSVPTFADYLHSVNLAPNFETSIFMALGSAKDFAEAHENCVVIGNCNKAIPFDIILGVNLDHEEGKPMVDLQVAKLKELYGHNAELGPYINNLYQVEDAEYHAGGTIEQIVELAVNLCQAKKS